MGEPAILHDAHSLVASGQACWIDAPPSSSTRRHDASIQPACSHAEQWLARDGTWRCITCDPWVFAGEVVKTRTSRESDPTSEHRSAR